VNIFKVAFLILMGLGFIFISFEILEKYNGNGNGLIKTGSSTPDVKISIIDGCEYIDNVTYGIYHVYTHKGNCKNKIHRYR
jgi:hypothetical protein